jgi:threonine dehydratase
MSIWDFAELKSSLTTDDYVTLGEGYTPIDQITIDGQLVSFKREDDNPSGSYKDRGTAYKITQLKQQAVKRAVISSSGNAAISFLLYGSAAGIAIDALVSPQINPHKLQKLQLLAADSNHKIHIDAHARQLAAKLTAETGAVNLKASTDPLMPIGYRSIGLEIIDEQFSDIFIATSSGTALVGIAKALSGTQCRIHACQTSSVHPITGELDQDLPAAEPLSLADAITDRIGLRKDQVLRICGNNGWVLSNHQIQSAYDLANSQLENKISYTSALAFAGFLKAKAAGRVGTKPLVIASGA